MTPHKQTIELPLSLALDISGALQAASTRSRNKVYKEKTGVMVKDLRARMGGKYQIKIGVKT